MIPFWLHILSLASLILGAGCAVLIVRDELRSPQTMWIMNLVWPLIALSGSLLALWAYFSYGRMTSRDGERQDPRRQTPMAMMVAKGTSHCGAGCTLGDIIAEGLAFGFPAIALALGWQTIFPEKIFAVWVLDFLFAFAIGVAFQYFAIKPMREVTVRQGIIDALKADTLSLTAWQVGMYGFMAIAYFWIFGTILGAELSVASVEFWFMMQIAMVCGFVTAYPVNWWLIAKGIKEKM